MKTIIAGGILIFLGLFFLAGIIFFHFYTRPEKPTGLAGLWRSAWEDAIKENVDKNERI